MTDIRTNVGSDNMSDEDRAAQNADLDLWIAEHINDGHCESCQPDGPCVTGPKCVTLGRDS